MTTVRRTALLDAPPSRVWDVLSDLAGISTWAAFVDHSSLMTEQAEGVGAARRIQTGRTTLVETITEWEPGVTLSYTITGLPPVIRSATNTWRLGASGIATMVWLTSEVDAGPRPPQQVIARAAARRLARSSDAMLAGLEQHLTSMEADS